MSVLTKLSSYLSLSRRVRAEYGVPILRQFQDIVFLSVGPGAIGPGDYYTYRLFEPTLTSEEKRNFVGWKAESWLDGLNSPAWHCMGLDKVLMYSLFAQNGLRVPETKAIYLAGYGRPFCPARTLSSPVALADWLRVPENYPFFSKPSASGFGRGACLAERYDVSQDAVIGHFGEATPVGEFVSGIQDVEHLGYLFQRPLEHDKRLVERLGRIVSSLRIMVLIDETEGPVVHRCFWKLPTGRNFHDNYNGGVSGNLAAAVDSMSGQVVRVINGTGLDVRELRYHPDTGVELTSVSVPDWEEVLAFTLRAASMLPKLRFQQWDIALSSQGPTALEVNLFGTGGGDLTQLLYRRGLLDSTILRFLDRQRAGTK